MNTESTYASIRTVSGIIDNLRQELESNEATLKHDMLSRLTPDEYAEIEDTHAISYCRELHGAYHRAIRSCDSTVAYNIARFCIHALEDECPSRYHRFKGTRRRAREYETAIEVWKARAEAIDAVLDDKPVDDPEGNPF